MFPCTAVFVSSSITHVTNPVAVSLQGPVSSVRIGEVRLSLSASLMATLTSYFVGSPHLATLSASEVHICLRTTVPLPGTSPGGSSDHRAHAKAAAPKHAPSEHKPCPPLLPGLLPRYLPGIRMGVRDVCVEVSPFAR